jgi:hypothetical protein
MQKMKSSAVRASGAERRACASCNHKGEQTLEWVIEWGSPAETFKKMRQVELYVCEEHSTPKTSRVCAPGAECRACAGCDHKGE